MMGFSLFDDCSVVSMASSLCVVGADEDVVLTTGITDAVGLVAGFDVVGRPSSSLICG